MFSTIKDARSPNRLESPTRAPEASAPPGSFSRSTSLLADRDKTMALRFLRITGGRAKRLGRPTRAAQQPLGLLGHYIAPYSVNGPEALRSVEFSRQRGWREFADRVRWTSRLSRRITAAHLATCKPALVATYLGRRSTLVAGVLRDRPRRRIFSTISRSFALASSPWCCRRDETTAPSHLL
jgi:hypothetical protein